MLHSLPLIICSYCVVEFPDLRNRHSGTLQARVKATGMCLFNLYISQHHPLNFILNADNGQMGMNVCQPKMEYLFTPTGEYFWKLFHIICLVPIIYQNAIFRKLMWPAIIILVLYLAVYTENLVMTGYELYTLAPHEFHRICSLYLQSIGGICVELILLMGSLEYYNSFTESPSN